MTPYTCNNVIGEMLCKIFTGVMLLTVSTLSNAVTYDLTADWSDVVNPNSVWSYNGNDGTPLTTNIADWDPTNVFFGSAQPAWAANTFNGSGHVPMWFKRTSDVTTLDIPVGVVGMHGSEGGIVAQVGVSWTSPINGTADITGGIWQAIKEVDGVGGNHANRNSDWRIRINDTVLTSGNLSGSDSFTSSSPFDLLTGSGGAAAITDLSVSMGDIIALEFISPTSFATFNGVDLTITAVPVPTAIWLFGSGLLGLVGIARRKKAA
jgi:hypothetical protein